jgi:hypothetical protein
MNHPKIIAGRHGLPPTSNIPWSAEDESTQRWIVLTDFIFMWIALALGIAWIFIVRPKDVLMAIILWTGCAGFLFLKLRTDRRKLYAMLLNKPRDLQGLTLWISHPNTPASYVITCPCGRTMTLVNGDCYFPSTRRFSRVCECGRGHFVQVGTPVLVKR